MTPYGAQQPTGQPYPNPAYPQQQQMQWPAQGAPYAAAPAKKRNVLLIVFGLLAFFFSLGPSALFAYNYWQYSTVEERWAEDGDLDPSMRKWGTEIVKDAAMSRMKIFGPVGGVLGLAGIVMFSFGLRKR
jgi:hypothetical protein